MNRRHLLHSAASAAAAALAVPAAASIRPGERRSSPGAPFKLAVAAYSYRKYLGEQKTMDFFQFIERCADMGSDGVELTEYYFQKPITPDYLRKLKRTAHLWGQTITGTPIGNSFTMPPGPERDRQIETYRRWVDISHELGSPAIRTFAGSAPAGVSESDARRNVIEVLNHVCEYAGSKGVFVGLENHGGVVAEADGILEIIKAVDSPWLGVNLDTGNFRTADPYGDMARCAPYAITVQFKVALQPRGKPKEHADFPRVLKILRDAGYRGFVTLEYEEAEDPITAVPPLVKKMRQEILKEAGLA